METKIKSTENMLKNTEGEFIAQIHKHLYLVIKVGMF